MKWKLLIIILVIVAIGGGYFYQTNNKDAWDTAFAWTGIKHLPDWATDKKIETKGSAFSREFVITFSGSKDQIEEWVREESALNKITQEYITDDQYRYILIPRNGAQYAEVIIDISKGQVTIRTYWS